MYVGNNLDFNDMFEEKLCEYTNANHAVCVDCCTNAILISLYLKTLLGEFGRDATLLVPNRTYMSVPMTLKLFGFNVVLDTEPWFGRYQIFRMDGDEVKETGVYDAAVEFRETMMDSFPYDALVCLSFQQKKRLNLGRGGAILTNNTDYYVKLKRLVHDGRNPKIYHGDEIERDASSILCGFHSYLEPEKAARGLMMLNQSQLLPPYVEHSSEEYPDLRKLGEI